MDILYIQDARLVEWASERLQVKYDPAMVRTLASIDESGILCVVLYSNFSARNCEMSIASASPSWCSRRFLRAAFSYPFITLNLRRVVFITGSDNRKTIDLCERLGAKREGLLRNWFDGADGYGTDGIIYGLLREECIWINIGNTNRSISRHLTVA